VNLSDQVAQVRAFNRFYTRVIGVLNAGLAGSPYPLVEARVLYELAGNAPMDGAELRRALELDTGYLSRVLGKLESAGLVHREQSAADARRQIVRLTDQGTAAFEDLDERQAAAVRKLLDPLPRPARGALVEAMGTVRAMLGNTPPTVILRPPRPGDLGWVVSRNGALYAQEYGWNADYEALVARIVADYAARPATGREAGWIAEVGGRAGGAVFCTTENEYTARLRLLHVEPFARGTGLGARLVAECLRFAASAGYRRITLWTVSLLTSARGTYQRAGFTLDDQSPFEAFGHPLTQQNWSRGLG
jgi:DNA-binding MarR family transcriptional regulator/GNAT superfamily N-acetyltransferase